MLATRSAIQTFRDVLAHPDALPHQNDDRVGIYDVMFDYYSNRTFENLALYQPYMAKFRLYRSTRLIYNPVTRLVDFYAGQVYPGVLRLTSQSQADSQAHDFPDAIPLADIEEPLSDAIRQLWQWTNFQARKNQYVRTGAMTGNVLVAIVDDVEREKILFDIIWPGRVADITLDKSDNVTFYAVEYRAVDADGLTFTYRKEVDAESIKTFRDGAPEGFDGRPPEYPNPYGFVPAVWAKHSDMGTDYGAPAMGATYIKIDELNSLASHCHDQIHKLIESPQLISTDGDVVPALKAPDAAEADIDKSQARLFLKTVAGASVAQLTGNLDLEAAMPYLEHLLTEIEQDHPELTFWTQLREMTQVTGPGASRLLGDVQARVWEAAANYDQQLTKLFQMSVAIGGWRRNRGDWAATSQTDKFKPFDLESYARGELDFTIAPRPLIPMNEMERVEERSSRATYALQFDGLIDLEDILIEAGFSEQRIQEILARAPEPEPTPGPDDGDGTGGGQDNQ